MTTQPNRLEIMTPRQRVQVALDHRTPDRVPIDFGGFQTGIHKRAYLDLLDHLGLDEEPILLDAVQQLVRPSEAVLQRFHVDTRYVCADAPDGFDATIKTATRNGRVWHDFTDEFGVVWSMPDDQQLYMDISHHPLADATRADLDDYPWPDGTDPSRFAQVRARAQQLRRDTPYALCTGISGVVYEYCWYLRGLEQWYIDMIADPEFCGALLDRVLRYWLDFETGFMQAIGDLVDVVMIGDDLAGQDGPLFSPVFYRSVVKPRQKQLARHIRGLTKARLWYHTCGNCVVYIDELADNGVNVLNPVQTSATGMDPAMLKARFGDRMVFWGGGIDTQHVLPFAGPDEIRRHVRQNLDIFKPGGGYVFNSIHNIQAGVPAENIVALFDAAYDHGFYGESGRRNVLAAPAPDGARTSPSPAGR